MRGRTLTASIAAVLLGACALGYRGEAGFQAEHDLRSIDELRIELPDTPITVEACASAVPESCPATLRYDGVWRSVAGSPADARDQAETPVLRFERDDGFAILRAEVPLEVDGLVDLEMGVVRLPDDRDLDLRTGVGDVSVRGTVASVLVDAAAGDVEIRGADQGLGVRTGQGDLDIVTPGHAELRTGSGHVRVQQSGPPRDLLVHTEAGNVAVTLASDADIDLEIHTTGRISVRTPSITTVTSGSLRRRNGNGSIRVELLSPGGDIEVTSVDPG